MIDLNYNEFCENFEKNLYEYHKLFIDIPLTSVHLEQLIKQALTNIKNTQNITHKIDSHSSGVDLILKQNNDTFKISIKSGAYNSKKNLLNFSSYRTTTFKTINEKINFINQEHSDFQINLAKKDNWNKTKQYRLFVFDSKQFLLKNLNFKEDESGWFNKNEQFEIIIRKKLSDQVWYTINLNNLKPLYFKDFNVPQHNLEYLSK